MVIGLGWPTIDQAKLTKDGGLRQACEHALFQKKASFSNRITNSRSTE